MGRFGVSEWRLVGGCLGERVWVNGEGVRVREERERVKWWAALRRRVRRCEW